MVNIEANTSERAYLFEKKCLHVANTCQHAAFAFDVLPNKMLDVRSLREITVSYVDQCLNACLDDPRCLSLNYVHADRHCQINGVSHRKFGQLKENDGSTYYENNCIHEKDRCGNKRIEFVMSKHREIRGKDISVGVRDIRNCMRECIESPLIFCRSFEFDSTTNECFISEDDSQSAISSENLNLYEPICVDRSLELRCSLPYLFEKFENKRLVSVEPLAESHNFSLEQCIEHCLYERNCRSLNYGHDRKCRLLPIGSDDQSRRITDDDNNDFYELSCKLATLPESGDEGIAQPPAVSAEFRGGVLIGNASLEECVWEEVERARTVHRPYRKEHLIGIKHLDTCRDACAHADFKCSTFAFSEHLKECVLSATVLDKESPDYKAILQYNHLFVLFKRKCRPSSIAEEIQPYAQFIDENANDANIVERNKGVSDQHDDEQSFENHFDEDTLTTNPSTIAAFTESLNRASWLAEMEQSAGQIPTIGPKSGHIPPDKVNVTAVCSENGVNVTFSTRGNNETLAVVVVMSNDRVTPLDVTTKDDLFYEIKCTYPHFVEGNEPTNIRSGLVVGGPNPRSILSSFERPTTQKANIVLKITKDGRAVDNVFIGEKLTAVVESDIEPDHLRVIDCNASRIGGVEPQPNSIILISQGCAMMPQIMGHVKMASQRLEAPLTAFRIDGSDQIEIACSVLVCKDKCPQKVDLICDLYNSCMSFHTGEN
uniref:Apple domain-containing protein n=1 Tax=Parascaris univalens TaxID=6257 RepID=A0A915B7R3_PARUN